MPWSFERFTYFREERPKSRADCRRRRSRHGGGCSRSPQRPAKTVRRFRHRVSARAARSSGTHRAPRPRSLGRSEDLQARSTSLRPDSSAPRAACSAKLLPGSPASHVSTAVGGRVQERRLLLQAGSRGYPLPMAWGAAPAPLAGLAGTAGLGTPQWCPSRGHEPAMWSCRRRSLPDDESSGARKGSRPATAGASSGPVAAVLLGSSVTEAVAPCTARVGSGGAWPAST